ncbi:MAG TPA: RsmD family RNA methyltransferase, partial [Candidatus Omnitrophota bacterium]|nr:RsmD family RNA methyltransferase [Candidatus Omnitrophota bacterium]
MKILTGSYRGRNFYMPADIRPTQNVARKAIFDLIGHDLSGLTVLDLYAGSGALGLEALSLGASKVTFVEKA